MPYPIPLISEGLASYTNDDDGGAFPASYGNDTTLGGNHAWRGATTPVGNTNDGPLTQTVWWVVDLSSVPVSQRQQVLFYWQNSSNTGAYDADAISQTSFNLLKDYTVQINYGPGGGSPPVSGWSTVVTVTGNVLHSKQHLVNMAGANWIGVYVTAVHGSALNNNPQGKFKVFDAHLVGASDSWKVFGDSIARRAFMDTTASGIGSTIYQQIHSAFPGFNPLMEPAGIEGWTSTDILPYFGAWLADFPGKYVVLAFGTNDANIGGSYVTNFTSNMTSMVQQILSAGKIPVIPTAPWGGTANLLANIPTINTYIAAIIAANPGTLAGPDLYSYFNAHQSEIDPTDHIHPTDPALSTGNGYVSYRTLWVNWAVANIYHNVLSTTTVSKYKVRAVQATKTVTQYKVRAIQKTQCRSIFKIQLSGTGPKPYRVIGVNTILDARPFSTVTSTALVVNQLNAPQSSLTATVVITFPDNSTATEQVYSIGNGQYTITYNTKGAGITTELWTFTDSQNSQIEYQHRVSCSF